MNYISNIQVNNKSIPIGGNNFDGQWVASEKTLSTATAIGTYTIDLSDYLPDDDYNYEVLILAYGYTPFSTGSSVKNCNSYIYSDIIELKKIIHHVSSHLPSAYQVFSLIVNKKVYIEILDGAYTNYQVTAYAYRRLGVNY